MNKIQFANLDFRGLRREELLRDDGRLKLIVTVNAEIIVEANRDKRFANIINKNLATLDGQWPYVLARWRTGRKDIEKISGSDFVYDLCDMAAIRGYRVFLLGARPEINEVAQRRLMSRYGVLVSGYSPAMHSYPLPEEMDDEILRKIRAYRPAILIVAFGAPKQEFWLEQHRAALESAGVCWALGAGGSLDFVAGVLPRAPVFLQRAGLESLWRLALQPKLRFFRILRGLRFLQYA
jgi:N-acetylglucosaminyldiphosphoundecaprenol N-acetyl-beta-D-mannosaminyltransferase